MMMMMMMTKMMMKMIIFFYRLCCGEEAQGRRYVEQSQWLPLHWSPLHGHQPSREFGVGVPCNGCQCSRKQWTQLVLTIIQNQRENWCVVIQFKVSISCILIILIFFLSSEMFFFFLQLVQLQNLSRNQQIPRHHWVEKCLSLPKSTAIHSQPVNGELRINHWKNWIKETFRLYNRHVTMLFFFKTFYNTFWINP